MNDLVAQLRLPRRPWYAGIRDSLSPNLNNVTTTKQAVTSATGMVVMARKTTPIATGMPTCRWDRRERGHGWEHARLLAPRFQAQLIRRLLGRTPERFDASAHG